MSEDEGDEKERNIISPGFQNPTHAQLLFHTFRHRPVHCYQLRFCHV